MRHLASTLMLIIANNSGASVVDAQITGNGWPSVQALGCKFTDKPSQLEENSRNCPASTGSTASTSTASKASAAHSGPINIMETVSPPLTSSSVAHNDPKILDRVRQKDRAPSYYPYAITIISPADGDVIRSNSGALKVIINVDAPKTEAGASLEKFDGLVHKILLDGKFVASGEGSTFQLQAVDRGVHSLKATLHRGQEEIQQSPPLTFTLLRHSSIRR
ncbi:hypothetical protein N9Y23_00155 [Pseudomonadales bacterium]|nr:hypothetical protein [Pseudomonadales bacterium]